jgi:hypothetical protein
LEESDTTIFRTEEYVESGRVGIDVGWEKLGLSLWLNLYENSGVRRVQMIVDE